MSTMLRTVTTPRFPDAAADFKLSITRALGDQLADKLSQLTPAPLTTEATDDLRARPGVYELYLHGRRIYVGKASGTLPQRLNNHLRKLSGRSNIRVEDVSFLCLYVDEDLEAAAPETLLIKKYKDDGGVAWNFNGFGNKDPGRNRDGSVVKAKHFDALYPIDLSHAVNSASPGEQSVEEALAAVKKDLPFNLRYASDKPSKVDLAKAALEMPAGPMRVRDFLPGLIDALPTGWQATALPGYVILYRETKDYGSARLIWRKDDGQTKEIEGLQKLDDTGDVSPESDAE